MAKKHVLQDFENYSITKEDSESLKGGRYTNPIHTGSSGFINWDDVEIREPNLIQGTSILKKRWRYSG